MNKDLEIIELLKKWRKQYFQMRETHKEYGESPLRYFPFIIFQQSYPLLRDLGLIGPIDGESK